MKSIHAVYGILIFVIMSSSVQVKAQEASSSDQNAVERIEVVGSRIKRITKEGAKQVSQVKKDSMKNSANTSVSESLRDSAASMSGSTQYAYSPISVIGLNGLDPSKTLVLLNGHRLPTDPGLDAVDINSIPQAAVERIEILKGGSAALYGSDAMGGVINIITKKNIKYTEMTLKYSTPEKIGGNSLDVSAVTGLNNEKHDLTLALSYTRNEKILGKDREITKNGLSGTGPAAAWSDGTNPYVVEYPSECDPDLLKNNASGQRCFYRYNEVAATRPGLNQFNLLSDYTYRLPSSFKIYNRNTVMYRDINWLYAPEPLNISVDTGTASKPSARELSFRILEAGNRVGKDTEFGFNSLVGLKGNITSDLELDTTVSYGEINQYARGKSGYFNEEILKQLIAAGTYDPLAPKGSRGDFSAAVFEMTSDYKQRLFNVESVVSGDLFTYNDQAVGFAGGVSFLADRQKVYTGAYDGTPKDDTGYRTISSVFAELNFPMTSKLELNGAARFDHYSDFGNTINPKISAKYTMNDQFLIRSSVGTGFKAPRFLDLYQAKVTGTTTFIDRKLCQTDPSKCEIGDYAYEYTGNQDLKEEKSWSASLGTVYQPTGNFSISLDGWYNIVNNIIDIDYEDITRAEVNGVNPADYGVTVTRDGSGMITNISYKKINLSSDELAGIDLNFEYSLPQWMTGYTMSLENDFSYMLFDKYEGFPGAGKHNLMGNWGKPQWRNKMSFRVKNDISELKVSMRSIPAQNVEDRYTERKISDLNEWDVDYTRSLDPKCQFSVGIKNITNAAQPADIGGGYGGATTINESLYDINGRRFFVTYTEKF